MNKYIISLIIVTLVYAVFMLATCMIGKKDDDVTKVKSRGGRGVHRENRHSGSIKKQLEHMIGEKADVSKKYKIETMCLQAGHELSYTEFKILCIAVAIALPLVMLLVMNNIYLAFVFAFIGYNVPGQVIKTMANKRVIKMENQVGSFLRIVLERYKSNKDLPRAIVQTLPDFKGHEPFYSELKQTVVDINLGIPTEETLDALSRRTGSKFLLRFSDYYKITESLATHSAKIELLNQAFLQYEEHRQMKTLLKKEIAGPVREAYIMVMATPIFMLYQSFSTEGYLDFMLHEKIGQVGLAGVVLVLLGCVWFINAKIGAPIE